MGRVDDQIQEYLIYPASQAGGFGQIRCEAGFNLSHMFDLIPG
jgi:hypothetical protein